MKFFLIYSLFVSFSIASSLDELKNYNCETQNFDFKMKAVEIMQNQSDFYNKDELKKLYASYYYHAQDGCRVNSKKWCEAYKRVNKSDYETFKTLYNFKCGNF